MFNELLKRGYLLAFVKEETGFSARVLEFPGCIAEGESLMEAYQNLLAAADSWLAACGAQGTPIPEPLGYERCQLVRT